MTLRDLLALLRERWRLVTAGVLLGLAAAAAVTLAMPTMYRADAVLYVSARSGDDTATSAYQGSLLSEQRMKSYTQLAAGKRIAQEVVDRLRLPESADVVAGELSAVAQPGTVILTVSAVDRSPVRAAAIANAASDAFTALVGQLEQGGSALPPAVTADVVQPATPSDRAVSPRPLVNGAAGLVFGFLLGVAAAMVRSTLDTSMRSVDDLQALTGVLVLGTIDFDPEVPKRPLIIHTGPQSSRAESFQHIRTNVQFIDLDNPPETIVVTSALADEGKSTTACNLAIAIASAGSSVVLVDGDMRRPRVADYLGLDGHVGLTTVLTGAVRLDDVVTRWEAGGVDVLLSGAVPPNPSKVLASQQFAGVLDDLRARYDIVLIDTPPLLPVSDAATITARCDGAILVVRHGRTTRNDVAASVAALEAVSGHLLGAVMTMTPPQRSDRYMHYRATYADPLTDSPASDATQGTAPQPPSPRPRRHAGPVDERTDTAGAAANGVDATQPRRTVVRDITVDSRGDGVRTFPTS